MDMGRNVLMRLRRFGNFFHSSIYSALQIKAVMDTLESVRLLSCHPLGRTLANTPKESDGQGCVPME